MKAPPLFVWVTVSIISATMLSLTSYFAKDIGRHVNFKRVECNHLQYKNLLQNKDLSNEKFKVVIIGNSLLLQALNDPLELESKILERHHINCSIVKITPPGATLENFLERDSFLEELLRYDPHLLVIQEDLFMFSQLKNEHLLRSHVQLTHLLAFFFQDCEPLPLYNHNPEQANRPDTILKYEHPFNILQLPVRDFINDSDLQNSLSTMIEGQTKLAICHVPYPYEAEMKAEFVRAQSDYLAMLQWAYKEFDIKYMKYNRPMSIRYFHDATHMSGEGETLYTDWFIEDLVKIILKNREIIDPLK